MAFLQTRSIGPSGAKEKLKADSLEGVGGKKADLAKMKGMEGIKGNALVIPLYPLHPG
jgi:hypothetical protein